MSATTITPDLLENPDLIVAYRQAFQVLKDAYWHASDIPTKDLIYGVQTSIGQLLTLLNEQQLAENTADFTTLIPQMKSINDSLAEVKQSIDKITRDFQTASTILAAINKVISLLPL